jgi:hypothetical protein
MGLNRFDGRNFIVYHNIPGDTTSLANNIINAMCVDSAGHIWAATNGGLCYYTFSDDAFHNITFNDTLEKIDRHRVHAITNAMDNGIWFATKSILHKWNKNKIGETVALPSTEGLVIRYLYADQNHQVWIGTNEGLYAYNELTKKLIHKIIGSPFSFEKKLTVTIHPILQFDKDTLIIGSWFGDLQKVFLSGDSIYSTPLLTWLKQIRANTSPQELPEAIQVVGGLELMEQDFRFSIQNQEILLTISITIFLMLKV